LICETDVLAVQRLRKTYKSGKQANRDVSLELHPAELFCLMGPNGAGKTTFVRQLAGLLRPSSGDIWVCGTHVNTNPRKTKSQIGYQPQHLTGLSELTFREAVYFIGRLRLLSKAAIAERVEGFAAVIDLESVWETQIGRLSGGYRKILSLVLALLPSAPLVLLDEPTAGLDPIHRRKVWRLVHQAREAGAAVLVASHHLDEIESHADRYAIMIDGRWVKSGDMANLAREACNDAHIAVRIFPIAAMGDRVRDILNAADIPSQVDEDQRCVVAHVPRGGLGEVMRLYTEQMSEMAQGITVGRGELESYYMRAVAEEGAS